MQSDSQLNLHLNIVMEQINDDSEWYNSEDDLVGDDQDGELDFDISGRDPLDRAGDEVEHDEGDTSTHSPVHHEDAVADDDEEEDDMDYLSQSGEQCPSNTSTQQVLGLPTDSWDLDDFLPVPGPKLNMEPDSHPYEFFCKDWGEETFQELAEQTNLYALQKGTAAWVDTSEEEMRSFLGIGLAMGLVRLQSLKDYWSTNPLVATPGIVKGISRNRFRSILSHLHIDNSQMPRPGSQNFDTVQVQATTQQNLPKQPNSISTTSTACCQRSYGAFQG